MSQAFVSLEKALDILCVFDLEIEEQSAQQIAATMGFPLSSTYKYLEVLLRKDFLEKNNESKKYRLGRSLLQMSNYCIAGKQLSGVALDEMRQLTKSVGETTMLTVVKGNEAMCLEKVESRQLIKVGMKRGATRPLHAGGTSKMLLAHQKKSFINKYLDQVPLTAITDETIVGRSELMRDLEMIRKSGFAYSDSEVEQGVLSVGAPIFDRKKKVIAVLAIIGMRERSNDNNISQWVKDVKKTAGDITWVLNCSE
jgi:IclR family transcriptional regulator, KDG regulon repressor